MSDDDGPPPENIPGPSVPADAISRELLITNKRGLHARASAKFVQAVERFPGAEVWVTRGSETVGGRSIMGLMMLGAAMGDSIIIHCEGPYSEQALQKLVELIEDRFGEE